MATGPALQALIDLLATEAYAAVTFGTYAMNAMAKNVIDKVQAALVETENPTAGVEAQTITAPTTATAVDTGTGWRATFSVQVNARVTGRQAVGFAYRHDDGMVALDSFGVTNSGAAFPALLGGGFAGAPSFATDTSGLLSVYVETNRAGGLPVGTVVMRFILPNGRSADVTITFPAT